MLVLLSLLLVAVCFAVDINFQTVKLELFFDNDIEDDLPCNSPDNYTMIFKDLQVNNGACTTHLFPQVVTENDNNAVRWMQFSLSALAREDGGLQMWLYFTRNENTGAITYCAEQNIAGLPYPLEIPPTHNEQCIVVDLPKLDPYSSEDSESSMAVRVSFDTQAVEQVVLNRAKAKSTLLNV